MDVRPRALCADYDPELWFAKPDTPRHEDALIVCERCPIMDKCRDFARTRFIEYGTFGGESADDRKAYWRENGITVPWARYRQDTAETTGAPICDKHGIPKVQRSDRRTSAGWRCKRCTSEYDRTRNGLSRLSKKQRQARKEREAA